MSGQGNIFKSIYSSWPRDIRRRRSGSTFALVMACCLRAPSHYLNQCWPTTSKIQWHPSESNFNKLENCLSKFHWNIYTSGHWVIRGTKKTRLHSEDCSYSGLILLLHPASEKLVLLCNNVSHWLGTNLESALLLMSGSRTHAGHNGLMTGLENVMICYCSLLTLWGLVKIWYVYVNFVYV